MKKHYKNKGKPLTEQHKKQISDAKKGKPLTEQHKKQISDAKKGKPLTEQHKKQIRGITHKFSRRKIVNKRRTSTKDMIPITNGFGYVILYPKDEEIPENWHKGRK